MLNKNFKTQKQEIKTERVFYCDQHPDARYWLPLGHKPMSNAYRCEVCNPPPSPALVGMWAGRPEPKPSHAAHPHAHPLPTRTHAQPQPTPPPIYHITINMERPTCPACHGAWIVERAASPDAPIITTCYSCRSLIPSLDDTAITDGNNDARIAQADTIVTNRDEQTREAERALESV